MTEETYYQNFLNLVVTAKLGQVEQAAVWYCDAEKVAHEVARNLDTSLEAGASVVSAFSPRERWATNIEKAVSFSLGQTVTGLSNNLKMAKNSLVLGYDALKGPKTNAFARAIAGDTQAVVVDVWMMRAAGFDGKSSPTKLQYKEISSALVRVAEDFYMTPRTTQALLWILIRGGAQ
jgi:hypothetical protein